LKSIYFRIQNCLERQTIQTKLLSNCVKKHHSGIVRLRLRKSKTFVIQRLHQAVVSHTFNFSLVAYSCVARCI